MVGYSRDELLTMCISDLEIDESSVETAAHIERVIAAGSDRFETRHRHKLGHLIDLEISVSHTELNGGTNYVFARDISELKRLEQAVATREQEFRSMAESSPDFIVRYDCEGRHRYLNARLLKLLELASTDDVIGKRPSEVWTDGRFAELEQAAARAVASGSQVDIEFVQPTANGTFRYDQIFIVPERDVSGQIVGTIAFGREISAIREAERKLKHFVDNLPGMAYTFRRSPDGHGSFPFISPSVEKFYGLKPEDVQDDMAPLYRCWHPDDQMHIEAAAAESARTMTPFRIEARVCRPGQPERWLEGRALPEREADGSILWYGLLLDITERKRAEEALRASEQKFRSLAENLPDILIRYDREGRRTYINPVMGKLFSVMGKETIGLTPQEANPLNLPEQYYSALKHTLATGERSEFEMVVSSPLGVGHTGYICIAAERDANGEISGAISIGRDITKLLHAERQLRELTAHLQTVREDEKARLAREIHDDLGSTLAALKFKVHLLLDFDFPEDMKKMPLFARLESMLPLLESAIASMRGIISNMRPDVLDSLGLFSALKWQAEQFCKHTGIACWIVCANDRGCKDCTGCEYQLDKAVSINLFRIFQEALTNVARHSGASSVEAEFHIAESAIVLSISDNGCGLPEGYSPASSSFGIRSMRERVRQIGGEIEFANPPGGGFSVVVRAPRSFSS